MAMKNHLYIVTGASRGLGLAVAQQLLQPGHTVLCISRNTASALNEHVEKIDDATLAQWTQDLNDGAAASERLSAWLRMFLGDEFDSATLINNAAIVPRVASLSALSSADIAATLRVGLEAPMLLTSAFLRATNGKARKKCSTFRQATDAARWLHKPATAPRKRDSITIRAASH
jgi:benzil reductase ((S)-benzoin forming)